MRPHAYNLKDLTGRRFGRLTVLEYEPPEPGRRGARWICLCDCGVRCTVDAFHLISGKTSSCGCYRKEVASRNTVRAHEIWRIPVAVDGTLHPSMEAAAKAAGCSVSAVHNHLRTGKPFRGHTFTTQNQSKI